MKRPAAQRPRQATTKEVLDSLLDLVQRKFYAGEAVQFAKDRRRILQWALLWPARHWFDPKQLSVSPVRYHELMSQIIIEAAAFQAGEIRYRPAYLGRVVQSHFECHGDEIYVEAKAVRSLAQHALLTLGTLPQRPESLVADLTAASRLLTASKPKRKTKPAAASQQLDLLGS